MNRILFSAVLSLLGLALNSQTIKGLVLNKDGKKPIPYVSIGIINTPMGTYANVDGQFEMTLAEYQDADSLRFSCIGYESVTYNIIEFLELYNTGLDTIFLSKKVTELEEVVVQSKRNRSKKVGNKTSTNQMILGLVSEIERGIIIENDTELFLKSVSFKLTMANGIAPDSAIFRFNIYNLKDGLPSNNVLIQPIYFHLKSDQFEGENEFELSEFNITISEDFAATFELINKFGGNQIYFAGWFTGNRSISKMGIQGTWLDDRGDKHATYDHGGRKIYQSLEIEVLFEK